MINSAQELWDIIGVFEDKEVKAWEHAEPNRQEARACERMKAYVKVFEWWLDGVNV